MYLFLIILCLFVLLVFVFLQQEKFGKLPSGKRLEKLKQSPNYKNNAFKNISLTPDLTEGVSYYELLKEFFFDKKVRVYPSTIIPSVKTNLLDLDSTNNVLVWFGHSSYFMQVDGKRILVDPVFSGAATPLPFGTKAFPGTNDYYVKDMPTIDYLFISHDHWDHLDYDTVKKLKPKIKQVICGLGVGQHLEHWGYDANSIIEKDWHEKIELDNNFIVHTVSARHFSGRGLRRNKSLWMSYVLQTPSMRIFIGGDSGYDKHFADIGKSFGPFDIAILENGQYDRKWRYIHLLPNEILQAAKELQAKKILPVHSSKFVLGSHAWDEPLRLITENNEKENLHILTPMIGEAVYLKEEQKFSHWWKDLEEV